MWLWKSNKKDKKKFSCKWAKFFRCISGHKNRHLGTIPVVPLIILLVFEISLGVGCTLLLLGDLGLNVTTIQSVFGYRNNWKVTFKQLGDVILCIVNVCKSEVRKFCRRYFVCLLSNLGYALQQYTLKFFFGNIQSAHVLVLIILMMIL